MLALQVSLSSNHFLKAMLSMLIDYFNPSRANPLLCKAMKYTLHTSSTAVMLGCALFNYRDVGITEFIQRIWAA